MRGQELAAALPEGLGEDAMRAARDAMAGERARKRLRTADLTLGALILLLCLTILANALMFQAPSTFSPLPPHRPDAASPAPEKARHGDAAPAAGAPPSARAAAPPSAGGGMTEGTLGYLVGRTMAANTPAPAVVPDSGQSVRRPLSPVGTAPEPEATGTVRPPADVPGSDRVRAVQRTLARLGYGPLKVDGQSGAQTRLAIQRFQNDRNLPADGQISDRLVRELSTVSGAAVN